MRPKHFRPHGNRPGANLRNDAALSPTALWTTRPRQFYVFALAVCTAIFAVYSPSLKFQFILDDHRFTSDPRIQNPGHLWDYFNTFVWAQVNGAAPSFYRPLFLLWMRMNFLLSAVSPWGWHMLSIVKHTCVALLLGMLVWKLLRDPFASLLAAALFALHPAQTESVSWVTVPDPLMAAGLLTSLFLYLLYLESPALPEKLSVKKARNRSSEEPSPMLLLGSAAAYFTALLAKETAIIFPVVILAVGVRAVWGQEGTQGKRSSPSVLSRYLRQPLLQLLPFMFFTAVYVFMRLNALDGNLSTETQHLPWPTIVLSWPATLWFYVRAMLWPAKSYAYADPTVVQSFSVQGVLYPLMELVGVAAVVAAGLVWVRREVRSRLSESEILHVDIALTSGALLLILPLLLTLNLNALNPGDFLHGRYTYLPLAGLMLLIATVYRVLGPMRVALLSVAVAMMVLFTVLTIPQESQWQDDHAVFSTAHRIAPHNAPVAKNLADARVQDALLLEDEGRCSEAIPVFQQVSGEYPDDWYPLAGLGFCYAQNNDFVKAEGFLHRAADLSHDKVIVQQWQELRNQMGLPSLPPGSK